MDVGNLIKDIIEKIKLWFKNLFRKKKQINKEQNKILIEESRSKQLYKNITFNIDDNKSSTIGTIYYKSNKEHIELLLKKTSNIKRKIVSFNSDTIDKDIKIIENIEETINKNNLYINQITKIHQLLDKINDDSTLNLNTNGKLNILKENISTIIDKKLDNYEISIIEKAYREYQDVNYIIVTTLMIDDLIEEINEVNNDFQKNKLNKSEYERKIKKIKEKIAKLEEINNYKEVEKEIETLRKDFYTKKKDKYDLLYNDEIFINLYAKCDDILKKVHIKEEQTKKVQKKYNLEKKNEEAKKQYEQEVIKKEMEKEKFKEEQDNILKRFIDMEIAHKILILREKRRKKLNSKDELINETLNYYNDFLIGENNEFRFRRNKVKTEVTRLYNDITSTICMMQKKEFIPLEHINIKLTTLTEKTLEHQTMLNYMLEKKYQYKMEEHETSKSVNSKLTRILKQEKDKEKVDKTEKVLKKEFITQKENKNGKNN